MILGAFSPRGGGDARRRVDEVARAEGLAPESLGPLTAAWSAPSAAHGERAGGLCALDGRIENLAALARELGLPPDTTTDVVLLGGLRAWGAELAGRLRGAFVLALWDEQAASGLVARDPLGEGPLFHASGMGALLLGSEIRDVLALLPRRPAPDFDALGELLRNGLPWGERTLHQGIVPLRPGHALVLRRDGWHEQRVWAPVYRPPERLTLDEAATRLRDAVVARIAADDTPGPRGLMLSGGLDSSSVAGFAVQALGPGRPLRAYSQVFPGHPDADEEPLIEQVTQQLGIESVRAAVSDGSPLSFGLEHLETWAVPPPTPTGFMALPLLRAARDDGVQAMLTGEGGDELACQAGLLVADHLLRGDVRAALALARTQPGARGAPRRVLLRYMAGLLARGAAPVALMCAVRRPRALWPAAPGWLLPHRRGALDAEAPLAWRRLEGPRWWARLADMLTAGRQRMGVRDMLRRRMTMAGLAGRHPLLDLDVVETVLGLPPELSFDPSLSRPVLRAAGDGTIPDAVRLRPRKTYFDTVVESLLLRHDLATCRQLVLAPDAEIRAFVDLARAEREVFATAPRTHPRGPGAWQSELWRLSMVESWLRAEADSGFLTRLKAQAALPAAVLEWRRSRPALTPRSYFFGP